MNSLLASIVPSSVGFVLFYYGKRQSRAPHMVVGLIMMVYPYLVTNIPIMLGIAVVLSAGLWLAVRRGL